MSLQQSAPLLYRTDLLASMPVTHAPFRRQQPDLLSTTFLRRQQIAILLKDVLILLGMPPQLTSGTKKTLSLQSPTLEVVDGR